MTRACFWAWLVAGLATASGTVWAQEDATGEEPWLLENGSFSGSVKFATNYIFRGLSQTSDNAQVRGDVSWTHDSGLYAGIWSSNSDVGGEQNSMEFDPYIGHAGEIGDTGLEYDVGFWLYLYPGSRADLDGDGDLDRADFDFWEIYGTLTQDLDVVSVTGSLWYADDYFGDDFFPDTSSLAYHAIVDVPLPFGFALSGRLGRQTFDEPSDLGSQDYTYYDVGVSKTWHDFEFDLRWHEADGVSSELSPDRFVGGVVASVIYTI